ncbi:BTAD domain-containing putative transcriptional regulator [Catenulispora pinisilvae]|uniref:BTAD domain-containing putative transcriptional regulator n=1 Tax=Catenulispora pinisilvae TaxID=2705253 RepID=UPI001891D7E5|nr:BTAD domain-containing putative transcriptional regulator [Catenulispora pinisilvae]
MQYGDTLWNIAEHDLGSGMQWTKIYQANAGHEQPDGRALREPKLIQPGWTLTIPGIATMNTANDASTSMPSPVTTVVPDSSAQLPIRVPTPQPAKAPSTVPQRIVTQPVEVPVPNTSSVRPIAQPSIARAHSTTGPPASHATHAAPAGRFIAARDRHGIHLPTGGFVGIGLASCLGAAIAACHLLNRRRARLGSGTLAAEFALPEPAATLQKAQLVALASPGIGYLQDESDYQDPYPTVEETAVLAAAPAKRESPQWSTMAEPAPHQAIPGPAADCTPDLDEQLSALDAPTDLHLGLRAGVPIPLTTATADGLTLVGDGADACARALLLAAVAAGGPGPLRRAAVVYTTKDVATQLLGPSFPEPDPDRFTTVANMKALLDLLELDLAERETILADHEYADAAQLRRFLPAAAFWPVVVLAHRDEPRLADVIARARRLDIHVLTLGEPTLGTVVSVDASGLTSTSGAYGPAIDSVRAFHLTVAEAAVLLDQLNAARPEALTTPFEPFTDDPTLDGAPPAPEDPASVIRLPPMTSTTTLTRAVAPPGMVRIDFLGPITVAVGNTDHTSAFQNSARTLMTRLVVEPHGVSRDTLLHDLWPNPKRPGKPGTLHQLTFRLRAAFSTAAGRTDAFIVEDTATNLLRLNPAVITTDLDAFDDLRARADVSKDSEEQIGLYEAAVGLYRGPLAFGINADWLLPHRMDRQRDYADAATRLARMYGTTDAERTLAMLDAVLKRDPLNEDLYRRIMRVQAKLQRPDAVNRTLQLLEARCEEIQSAPDMSTYELAKSLARSWAA